MQTEFNVWTDYLSKLTETEREQLVQKETKLPGQWEQLDIDCPRCDTDEFFYLFADDKTVYCLQCGTEWNIADLLADDMTSERDSNENDTQAPEDVISDNPEDVKKALAALEARKQSESTGTSSTSKTGFVTTYQKQCFHRPQQIIAGEGWGIWAGKRIDCLGELNKFDVVINLTYNSVKNAHCIPIPELQQYESPSETFTELQIDWPDYGTTNLPYEFWRDLLGYLQANKLKALVFCLGGHGRTGTAMAVLLELALGFHPQQAIEHLRTHYCVEAVESTSQLEYIREMAYASGQARPEGKASDALDKFLAAEDETKAMAAGQGTHPQDFGQTDFWPDGQIWD